MLEFVIGDLMRRHTEIGKHLRAGFDHHGRTTEVILDGAGGRVVSEIVIPHDFVNEALESAPVVLGKRRGEREVETEIRMGSREGLKRIGVENLLRGAGTIPIAHPASGVFGLEEVGEVGAKRGHAGAAADVDHFSLGWFGVKIAEGTDGSDFIAGFKVKDIA